MRIFNLKIIVTPLALSLGIVSVWAIGGFSYLTFLFKQTASVLQASPQVGGTLFESNSVKTRKTFF